MGNCGDCIHLNTTIKREGIILNDSFYCEYLKRFVRRTGSCSYFEQRPEYSAGCYLTAACVDYFGKPDDCYELTMLRRFRDDYLKKTEEGKALVEEYYRIAPQIVDKINASGKQKEYYEYIYGVVTECVACLEKGEPSGALSRYRDMTVSLQTELM